MYGLLHATAAKVPSEVCAQTRQRCHLRVGTINGGLRVLGMRLSNSGVTFWGR